MSNKKTKFNYEMAVKELETIQAQLENNEIPVDQLTKKVKRANELLKDCQEQLRKTDEEIEKLL